MNFAIDQNLLALIIEAVKLPHVTIMLGMLGTALICAWAFK